MHALVLLSCDIVLSLRRALFSCKHGVKTGGQHIAEHLINRIWLPEDLTRSSEEGT